MKASSGLALFGLPNKMEPEVRRSAGVEHVNETHTAPTTRDGTATIRDALIWGAAFVPFIALALLPRRSQLNKLRGDISSLSRQSSKQSKSVLEALALLHQGQEKSLAELRQQLTSNTAILGRLESCSSAMFNNQEMQLRRISEAIDDVVNAEKNRDNECAAVHREAVAALEEARNHLTSSRRCAYPLWMEFVRTTSLD